MEHFYEDIQGFFDGEFLEIYREAVERAPRDRKSTFVEVGCWKGRSAAFMAVEIANSGKDIALFCVDTWLGPDKGGMGANPEYQLRDDPELPIIYDIFCRNLGQFFFVYPERMPSVEAAAFFADGSLDFVMIDASHECNDVREDVLSWTPKLRPDGIIAGDDYSWPGVWRAVNETIGYQNVRRRGRCFVKR